MRDFQFICKHHGTVALFAAEQAPDPAICMVKPQTSAGSGCAYPLEVIDSGAHEPGNYD